MAQGQIRIRNAVPGDLEAIAAIYNYEALNALNNLRHVEQPMEFFQAMLEAHGTPEHPLLVAEYISCEKTASPEDALRQEDAGAAEAADAPVVVGFGCLSKFRDPETYDTTAEVSVYVDRAFRQRGIATQLLAKLVSQARSCGRLILLVAFILPGNAASLALHEKFGFTKVGELHGIGYKQGQLMDVMIFELPLKEPEDGAVAHG